MTVPVLPAPVQQRATICVESKGDFFLDIFNWYSNDSHPMFKEKSSGGLRFGDGIRGSRPTGNAKHDKEGGHVVFGDGEHGVLDELCKEIST